MGMKTLSSSMPHPLIGTGIKKSQPYYMMGIFHSLRQNFPPPGFLCNSPRHPFDSYLEFRVDLYCPHSTPSVHLDSPFTGQEIYDAFANMNQLDSLGPDGFAPFSMTSFGLFLNQKSQTYFIAFTTPRQTSPASIDHSLCSSQNQLQPPLPTPLGPSLFKTTLLKLLLNLWPIV